MLQIQKLVLSEISKNLYNKNNVWRNKQSNICEEWSNDLVRVGYTPSVFLVDFL